MEYKIKINMGIRLNKVITELNIGIRTAVDFLKNNQVGEIKDDAGPNTKITDEQYVALAKKFSADKRVKAQANIAYTNSILNKIFKNDGNIFLRSKEEIDNLLSELKAQKIRIDEKLDMVIRTAIHKVQLQKYYIKVRDKKKTIAEAIPKIKSPSIISKKAKKKKLTEAERKAKNERINAVVNRQMTEIDDNLTKLFYTEASVDCVIDFLKSNKKDYDVITESWIRSCISGRELLDYYIERMDKEFSNYQSILISLLKSDNIENNDTTQLKIKNLRNDILNYIAKRRGKKVIPSRKANDKPLIESKKKNSFEVLQGKEWILDWSCVMFKRGGVVIFSRSDLGVKFKPIEVSVPKSIESFNYLKKYLNERLPPVRCLIDKQRLTVIDKINFSEAILQFEAAARQGAIKIGAGGVNSKYAPHPMSFSQALSKAQKMTPEEFKKYKSKYIDFLVDMQGINYKVIPCVERLAHTYTKTTEYAFIFSIECTSDKVLIVHENVNPDRSTLIFLVKKETYDKNIREIYDFLQSPEINKRSSLREKIVDIRKAGILRYRSINHDEMYSWKSWITYYKNHA